MPLSKIFQLYRGSSIMLHDPGWHIHNIMYGCLETNKTQSVQPEKKILVAC